MRQGRLLDMAGRQLTSFEHILLGMICRRRSSGYDLKRIFAATPMGVYQPSSGALYPALRRLERKGLVRAQARAGGSQPGIAASMSPRRPAGRPTRAGCAPPWTRPRSRGTSACTSCAS